MAMTFTILGDILSPRQRSKYTGYFTAIFASASVIGPLVGGFFVDHVSWRWVFYVNLPLGVVALLVVAKYLQTPVPDERRPLDLMGAFLMTLAVVTIMLAAVWGGKEYAWGSTTILGLAGLGVVALTLFVLQERRVEEQILPFEMFRNDVFRICVSMSSLLGGVMVGAAVFLPLYLQVVKGVSATSSGFLLVPMMGGVVLGSNVCGRIVNLTGRYKIFTVLGSGTALLGLASLLVLARDTSRMQVSLSMALLGLGIGTCMPITTLAVQNIATEGNMGAATSAVNFFRSLGSSFGVALFGTLMTMRLESTLTSRLPGTDLAEQKGLLSSPKAIRALPQVQFDAVADGIVNGLHLIFQFGVPLMAIAFVLSFRLREIPLRDDLDFGAAMVEGMEEASMFAPGESMAGQDHRHQPATVQVDTEQLDDRSEVVPGGVRPGR
jgi:MFS family permease